MVPRPAPGGGDAPAVQRKVAPGAAKLWLGTSIAYAARAAAARDDAGMPHPYELVSGASEYDERPAMPAASATVVQRKAAVDAMDAPKQDSIREDRATIEPTAAPPTAASTAPATAPGRPTAVSRGSGRVRDLNPGHAALTRADAAAYAPGHDAGVVTTMDTPKEGSIREDRATIEPAEDEDAEAIGLLSPEQAAHAVSRNRHTTAVYHVRPADVDTRAAPNTPAFAQAVARFQAAHGLVVDGIVGPKTVAALRGDGRHASAAGASQPAAGDSAPHQPHASLLQMKQAADAVPEADVPAIAATGVAGSGQPLPHADRIQAAFGAHDVSGIRAHVGGAAREAARGIGAVAYATGSDVAFDGTPDLHTAAHEAAHVVQQHHGVQLKGGVGQVGDPHEQSADAAADAVVRGASAEAILDRYAAPNTDAAAEPAAVQKKLTYHQRDNAALVKMLLRAAAAQAAAGLRDLEATDGFPSRLNTFRAAASDVASLLRQAFRDALVPGGMSASLRPLVPMAELAYTHALELVDSAGRSSLYDAPRDDLRGAMHELADLFAPVWRRPKTARDNQRRERRADKAAPPRALSAGDQRELVHLTLHTATHRARALEASGGAKDVDSEVRGLRDTAAFIAEDVAFAIETMTSAFTTPGQRRPFAADIEELGAELDGLAEWANAEHMGATGFAELFAKETALRRLVGKAPRTRAIEGPHIDGQAGQVVGQLLSPGPAGLGAHKTKQAALGAIHDELGLVFRAVADGIHDAKAAVEEPAPPKTPSDWHVLLDIAIDAALVFPGASVATAIAELPALAARKVLAGGVKASLQQLYKSSIAAARAGTRTGASAPQKDPANAGAAGSVAGRTPKTQYFSIQADTVRNAQGLALANFANLRDQLANLDLDTLNDVSAQLRQLAVGPTIKHAQEEATLTEWVNFKARWIHGAPEGSKRDADLSGVSHRDVIGGVASVLNVFAGIDPQIGPNAKVTLAGLSLPGVEPSVIKFFQEKSASIGALPFNRVVRVNHGGGGEWRHITLVWSPDGNQVTLNDVTPTGEALLIAYALGKFYERGFEFYDDRDTETLLRVYGRDRAEEGARKLVGAIARMPPKALKAD